MNTDTISDMLTRIRNSYLARKAEVDLPYSKFKLNLAKLLLAEGWIKHYDIVEKGSFKSLNLNLRYLGNGEPAITGIKRISKPGQRIYSKQTSIPKTLGGIGTTIVSTPKGLMTDKQAKDNKVGGELICQIW